MKHFLLFAAVVLFSFGTIYRADAREPEDQEFRHVELTLTDGTTVDGYIHRDWGAMASYYTLKRANYSLKIVPTPDSDEAVKYTVEELASIRFTEPSERFPEGERWEVQPLARPRVGNLDRTVRSLARVEKSSQGGTVYWWQGYASTGYQGRQTTTCDCYGIRFRGDSAVYNFLTVGGASAGWSEMMIVFKKKNPELREALKEYYEKGEEYKEHVRELKEDPSSILNFCDAFFAE